MVTESLGDVITHPATLILTKVNSQKSLRSGLGSVIICIYLAIDQSIYIWSDDLCRLDFVDK